MTYGTAVFGDNQFLGVNHSDQAKAAELFERFSHPDRILEVLAVAYDSGLRDFMFTTHERYEPVFDEIRRSSLFPGMHYTPCLPYAHKYWNKLSNEGLVRAMINPLMQAGATRIVPAALGLLMGRSDGVISLLTQVEILMCKGLPLRGVFLQNAVTDLLLSMGRHLELEGFARAVTDLGLEPGFITMNHPAAVRALTDEISLDRPWICANYNIAGVRMNPSPEAVQASFSAHRSRNMAMSVFAWNEGTSDEALAGVLRDLDAGFVDAILFGSSSPKNIKSNATIIGGLAPVSRRFTGHSGGCRR